MSLIQFFIPGLPAPGGSKSAFVLPNGKANQTPACKRTKPWMALCAIVADQVMRDGKHAKFTGPVQLDIDFIMPRRKGDFRSNGTLKPNAPCWHTVKPDRTKLTRSTEDALTGIVWRDDSAVVDGNIRKLYGDTPGALVTVSDADPAPEETAILAALGPVETAAQTR